MQTKNKVEALYISGPMTGIPEHNFPLFNEVARTLRAENYIVYNPAEHFDGRTDLPREEYMREDFKCLLGMTNYESYGIVLLPGWTKSKGAVAEVTVARELGFRFFAWLGGRLQETVNLDIRTQCPDTCPDTSKADVCDKYPATGEVRITDPTTGGQKGQKDIQISYIPYEALGELSKVYVYGAEKYARDNWKKGYAWNLNVDALYRHLGLFNDGEDLDPESGLPHIAHCAWHCLTLLWFMKHYPQGDYRAISGRQE